MAVGPGSSDEADEGAAGEEQNERVSQKQRDCFVKEGPKETGGQFGLKSSTDRQTPQSQTYLFLSAPAEATGGSETTTRADSEEEN